MLQRLSEDFEYAECLDNAARCEDSCEQVLKSDTFKHLQCYRGRVASAVEPSTLRSPTITWSYPLPDIH